MRLKKLELIKYGKFTGEVIELPRAECDFHLIVGPNEAGKSTLRRAVSELLYGMELRSDMDFLHPLPELRLGGVIESDKGTLAFHRCRGRKSLRRPDDEVLPESVLVEHLGTTQQGLFDRMFCLDLNGLLKGGQSILDASDDMGQVLFQSAAGISSLGTVRDALAAEAASLYAPRKSGERLFYQALERYETAKQDLKAATVNTRSWSTANAKVEAVRNEIQDADGRYNDLSAQRRKLERIHRIATRVVQFRDVQAELQRLGEVGEVIGFPQDASRQLSEGERAIATQTTTLDHHRRSVAALEAQIKAIRLDEAILAIAADVETLATHRQTYANHERDIGRRTDEVNGLLTQAAVLAAQLSWPQDEAGLWNQLPTALALKTLKALMNDRGALAQARQSAEDNRDRAKTTLDRLQAKVSSASGPTLSAVLDGALQEAQAFKQSPVRQRAMQAALDSARSGMSRALGALGRWTMEPDRLATLVLPSEERLASLKTKRAVLHARVETASQLLEQAREQARTSALALTQFSAGRSLVTLDEVLQARAQRDGRWHRIRIRAEALEDSAALLEQAMGTADRLVDSQRDSATDSAKFLSLRQDSERDMAAVEARLADLERAKAAQSVFKERWIETVAQAGLPGLPFEDMSAWLVNRSNALDACGAVEAKALELRAERESADEALRRLHLALRASRVEVNEGAGLSELCTVAEKLKSELQAAAALREALSPQVVEAETEIDHHKKSLLAKEADLRQWEGKWQAALMAARLDTVLDTAVGTYAAASGAVEVIEEVRTIFAQIEEKRVHRIQLMEADLEGFTAAAVATLVTLGLPTDGIDPFEVARTLFVRLQQAREAKKELDRLTGELNGSKAAVATAQASLDATQAGLRTLYELGKTEELPTLQGLIAASDRYRECAEDLRAHKQALMDSGDGLILEDLLAEYDTVPSELVKPQLEALEVQLTEVIEHKTQLASNRTVVDAELQAIKGGTDAAVAESKRLEALAQMGDVAERYMKVASAVKLLRWTIDRYRERKQGPLLQRASGLFSQMTLGNFSRLAPDYEVTPPKLIGIRASGEKVRIEGLSEGTRDQLFLALRLAALEMQIEGDRPLPFIADDLFVNFNDSRSRAGLRALGELSRQTQMVFLTHHEHLVDVARECIGSDINVVELPS